MLRIVELSLLLEKKKGVVADICEQEKLHLAVELKL